MAPSYDRYCIERQARRRAVRVGRRRATADLVNDLLELTSSDDDTGLTTSTRHGQSATKTRPVSSGWSLFSTSFVPAVLSISSDEDVNNSTESIQSYTSQLFSPLYNTFKENRRPWPEPDQTPTMAHVCYEMPERVNHGCSEPADEENEAAPSEPPIHHPTIAKTIKAFPSHDKHIDVVSAKATSHRKQNLLLRPIVTRTKVRKPDLRMTTNVTRANSFFQTPKDCVNSMRSDRSSTSFASADSGPINLEPSTSWFGHDSPPADEASGINMPNDTIMNADESLDDSLSEFLDAMSNEEYEEFIRAAEETRRRGQGDGLIGKALAFPLASPCDFNHAKQPNVLPSTKQWPLTLEDSLELSPRSSNMRILGRLEPLPSRLFYDLVDKSFDALSQVTLDALTISKHSLSPLFARSKQPMIAFDVSLRKKGDIRHDVGQIQTNSPLSHFATNHLLIKDQEPSTALSLPRPFDYSLATDSKLWGYRLDQGDEEASLTKPCLLKCIFATNERLEESPKSMGDSIRFDVPDMTLSRCADSSSPATSEPAKVLHAILSRANIIEKTVAMDCSVKKVALERKFASRPSPMFSYYPHLASLWSYDDSMDGDFSVDLTSSLHDMLASSELPSLGSYDDNMDGDSTVDLKSSFHDQLALSELPSLGSYDDRMDGNLSVDLTSSFHSSELPSLGSYDESMDGDSFVDVTYSFHSSELPSLGSYDDSVDGDLSVDSTSSFHDKLASSEWTSRGSYDDSMSGDLSVDWTSFFHDKIASSADELFSRSGGSDNDSYSIQDSQLRAVMEATRDGDHASNIFPSCSSESLYLASCESDDGLDSELDALEEIGHDLRQEIEAAESSISFFWISPTRAVRKKAMFDSNMANMCTLHGVSSSFSGDACATVVRRVRFNEEVEEFLFASDVREDHREASGKDESILDDVMGVVEVLLNKLNFACVSLSRAMERTAHANQSVRRSSVR